MSTNQSTQNPKEASTVSIGYHRDDGDFRILATLNNNDNDFTRAAFADIIAHFCIQLQDSLRDDMGEIPTLEVLERQDTPDYVTLDEDIKAVAEPQQDFLAQHILDASTTCLKP